MKFFQNQTGLIISLGVLALSTTIGYLEPAHAESLFHANATYTTTAPLAPRSLFTQPRPQAVGDIVTILVRETSKSSTQAQLKVNSVSTVTENSTSLINNLLHLWHLNPKYNLPSLNGLDNTNTVGNKAEISRDNTLIQTVSCQVVQVLPNGNLVVQGHKVVFANKEQQDLFLTGIVNPYFIDRQNQIASNQVADLQLKMGGRGVVSRQQGDGWAQKIYQFYH